MPELPLEPVFAEHVPPFWPAAPPPFPAEHRLPEPAAALTEHCVVWPELAPSVEQFWPPASPLPAEQVPVPPLTEHVYVPDPLVFAEQSAVAPDDEQVPPVPAFTEHCVATVLLYAEHAVAPMEEHEPWARGSSTEHWPAGPPCWLFVEAGWSIGGSRGMNHRIRTKASGASRT